ncbi:AAA family ATPase [Kocuria rosea]|uniref:AAA family ATPase n=1 Tax=Kocuria rosea TaxID=1275 RepID=UPI002041F260|nr:AAA family ATPase [Kocuria rosea]
MSLAKPQKIGGRSASAYKEYLKEQMQLLEESGVKNVAAYYAEERSPDGPELAFTRVMGSGAEYLGIENGITDAQFEDIHEGRWNGEQLCKSSYRPIYKTDGKGRYVYENGKKVKQYDETGKLISEPHRTSWIDLTFSAPSSVDEYLITSTAQERAEIIADFEASCAVAIQTLERDGFLVRKTIPGEKVKGTKQQGSATERVRGAKIIALPVTQFTARHTQDTIDRGAPPDPHLHQHTPIATMAFLPDPTHPDGMRPLTLDSDGFFSIAERLSAIQDHEFSRRMEERGIKVKFQEWDESKRGLCLWEIDGVSEESRRFHSSNSNRADEIKAQWEKDYGHPPTHQQLTDELKKTRKGKSKDERDMKADQSGVWDQWGAELNERGIEIWEGAYELGPDGKVLLNDHGMPVPARRGVQRAPLFERQVEFRNRLFDTLADKTKKSAKGLTVDNAFFSGTDLECSIDKAAIGLGFTQGQLRNMEMEIRRELVTIEPHHDPRYARFTTRRQLTNELRVVRAIDAVVQRPALAPSQDIIDKNIKKQKHPLDPEQQELTMAACTKSWVFGEGLAGAGKTTSIKAAADALKEARLVDEVIVVAVAGATAQRAGIKIGADKSGSFESIEYQLDKGTIEAGPRTMFIIDESAMVDTDRMNRFMTANRAKGRFVLLGDPRQLTEIGAGGWYEPSVGKHGAVMLNTTHRFTNPEDVKDYNKLRSGDEGITRDAVESMDKRGRVHISYDGSDRMVEWFDTYKARREGDKTLTADDLRLIIETTNKEVDTGNSFVQADRKARGELEGEGFKVSSDATGRSWRLYKDDSVIFLQGHARSGRQKPVKNGTTGEIIGISERRRIAKVRLEDDRVVKVPIPENAYRQTIAPAYCQHANKIQGAEARIVDIMPGTDKTANANSAYSQLTRGIDESHVWLDYQTNGEEPKQAVAKSWARRANKHMAITLMKERGLDPWDYVHEKSGAQRAKEARLAREARLAEQLKTERTTTRDPLHDRQQPTRTRTREGSLRDRLDDPRSLADEQRFGKTPVAPRPDRDRGRSR